MNYYFVTTYTTDFDCSQSVITCASLEEAQRMLMIAENTFYCDPHVSFCITTQYPN